MCEIEGCDEHYACQLRNKGLQVSPRVQMTRTQNWKPSKFSTPPARNKRLIYDERPGGYKMPVFNKEGLQMRGREYESKQHLVDAQLRRNHAAST
jgi:hypothetical protein